MMHFSTSCKDKFLKGISFLQDNATPHKAAITHQKWADLHFEVLKHPLDYYLFLILEGRKFSSSQ
jgi:hypothetical protein